MHESRSEEDQDRVRLQASAVVAHRVSKEAARQMVRRVELKLTLREVLILLVMLVALIGTSAAFLRQHSQDVSALNARRAANSERINDLQNQLSEQALQVDALQVLVVQLRNSLLALGVAPNSIPSVPAPQPSASSAPSSPSSPPSRPSAGAQRQVGNTDARPTPSAIASSPSVSASSATTSAVSSQPVIVVSLPGPLPPITVTPRR